MIESSSPKIVRRSEWPARQYSTPSIDLSMPGLTAPVNAPFSSVYRSCAPSETPVPFRISATDARYGNDTQIAQPDVDVSNFATAVASSFASASDVGFICDLFRARARKSESEAP